MTTDTRIGTLPRMPTYIGICCREWILVVGMTGRCGLCETVPVFLRPDPLFG